MTIKRIYLAGPMRGKPDFNYPAFADQAHVLRSLGLEVYSPPEHDDEFGITSQSDVRPSDLRYVQAANSDAIAHSDAVVVMDGWQESVGCLNELHLCLMIDIPVYQWRHDGTRHMLVRVPENQIRLAIADGIMRNVDNHSIDGREAYSRANDGKIQYSQMPMSILSGAAKVLEFGARKYAQWNWTKGGTYSSCFDSLLRHLFAWYYSRQENDGESGMHHLDHAICNLMFLRHWTIVRTDGDDRPPPNTGFSLATEVMRGEFTGNGSSTRDAEEVLELVGPPIKPVGNP